MNNIRSVKKYGKSGWQWEEKKTLEENEKAVRALGAAFARMNISNTLLEQFRRNKSEFWRRLITVDETRIHRYTAETFFVKWRGNHLREQLFCKEKRRVLFGWDTEMGVSLGEVCRVTKRLCWKIIKKFLKICLVSLLGRKLFRPPRKKRIKNFILQLRRKDKQFQWKRNAIVNCHLTQLKCNSSSQWSIVLLLLLYRPSIATCRGHKQLKLGLGQLAYKDEFLAVSVYRCLGLLVHLYTFVWTCVCMCVL